MKFYRPRQILDIVLVKNQMSIDDYLTEEV